MTERNLFFTALKVIYVSFHMIAAVILPMRRKTLNRQTNKPYETFGSRYSDEILPTRCKQPNNNALIWSSIVILTFTLYHDKGRYLKMGFCLIGSTRIGWNQLQKISHSVNKPCSSLKWIMKLCVIPTLIELLVN